MRISRVQVTKLFGQFDQEFPLDAPGGITIIYGVNGCGKTTVLRIVEALFSGNDEYLATVPFEEVRITFSGKQTAVFSLARQDEYDVVDCGENDARGVPRRAGRFVVQYTLGKERMNYDEVEVPRLSWDAELVASSVSMLEPGIQQIPGGLWRLPKTNEALDLIQIVARYELWDLHEKPNWPPGLPWARELFPYGDCMFLNTHRLVGDLLEGSLAADMASSRNDLSTQSMHKQLSTLEREAARISSQIVAAREAYSRQAQILNSNFPMRVFQLAAASSAIPAAVDSIKEQIESIRKRQYKLSTWGVIEELTGARSEDYDIAETDRSLGCLMYVYADDGTIKLDAVSDMETRIDTFLELMSVVLNEKTVEINAFDGILVRSANRRRLLLSDLSSGEQQILVMMCTLIFHTRQDTFILIDEPEISLHIAWQREFVDRLEMLARRLGFYVLLASHSPDIEHGHFDITNQFNPRTDSYEGDDDGEDAGNAQ